MLSEVIELGTGEGRKEFMAELEIRLAVRNTRLLAGEYELILVKRSKKRSEVGLNERVLVEDIAEIYKSGDVWVWRWLRTPAPNPSPRYRGLNRPFRTYEDAVKSVALAVRDYVALHKDGRQR